MSGERQRQISPLLTRLGYDLSQYQKALKQRYCVTNTKASHVYSGPIVYISTRIVHLNGVGNSG